MTLTTETTIQAYRNLADISDNDLIAIYVAEGSNEAFAEIVRRHEGPVRGLLLRMGAHPDSVPDLLQDLWMRLAEVAPRYDSGRGAKFRSWLCTIAANLTRNSFRYHNIRKYSLAADLGTFGTIHMESATDVDTLPDEWTEHRERLDAVTRTLETVSAKRVSVLLRHLNGDSHQTIAAQMGMPVNTVKTSLNRLRATLNKNDPYAD